MSKQQLSTHEKNNKYYNLVAIRFFVDIVDEFFVEHMFYNHKMPLLHEINGLFRAWFTYVRDENDGNFVFSPDCHR